MKRTDRILRYLLQNNRYVGIKELALQFGVSERTIRTELMTIEDSLRDMQIPLIRDRMQGVFIDRKTVSADTIRELMNGLNDKDVYYSSEERLKIILQTLLITEKGITLDILAEKTGVSKTTVMKDFVLAESWLLSNHIKVKKKRRIGLEIEYKESDWRNAVLEYLNPYLKEIDLRSWKNSKYRTFLILDPIIDEFVGHFVNDVNMSDVYQFLNKYEIDFGVRFLDFSYVTLLLYICIALSRVRSGLELEPEAEGKDFTPDVRHAAWIRENKGLITTALNYEVNDREWGEIVLHLLSAQKYKSGEENSQYVGIDVDWVVIRFLENVEGLLNVDFSDDKVLYDSLRMHISPTIHRISYNVFLNNPVHEDIVNLYPEIFAACKTAIRFLEKKLNNTVDENEISLLAMHVGAAVEKMRQKVVKKLFYHVLVVCADGVGASRLLSTRLLNEFTNIIVDDVTAVDELEEFDLSGIDLIITTIPLFLDISIAVIRVSPALKEEDILKIKKEMRKDLISRENNTVNGVITNDLMNLVLQEVPDIDCEKMKHSFETYLESGICKARKNSGGLCDYLEPELIKLNGEFNTWQEAVRCGGNLLYRQGFIQQEYIDKMIESMEEIGNCVAIFDGVIMPHSKPSHGVIKTGFSFITLKTPIKFSEEDNDSDAIRFVVTLAADDSMIHMKGIRDLVHILDEEFLDIVCKIVEKNEFIQFVKAKIGKRSIASTSKN